MLWFRKRLRLKDTRAGGCTGVPIDVRTECPDGCEAVLVTQVMARTSCPDPRTLRIFGSCTMSLRRTGCLRRQQGARAYWRQCLMLWRSEEHTSELQSLRHLVCRLLLEKK